MKKKVTPKSTCFKFIILLIISFQVQISFATHTTLPTIEAKIKAELYNHPEKAQIYAKELLKVSGENEVDSMIAKAYYYLGICNYFQGRNFLAVEYYRSALRCNFAQQSWEFADKCWNNMGVCYDILNMIPESFEAYQQSLKFAEKRKDSTAIAQCWINFGLLDLKSGNFSRSLAMTQKALDFFSRKNDVDNHILCYQNLSSLYTEKKDYVQSAYYDNQAFAMVDKVKSPYVQAEIYYNNGNQAFLAKDFNKAEMRLNEAFFRAENHEMGRLKAMVWQLRGEIEVNKKNYNEAEANFNKAKKLIDELKIFEYYEAIAFKMANLFAVSGQYQKYNLIMDEYHIMRDSFNQKAAFDKYEELKVVYESEKDKSIIHEQQQKIKSWKQKVLIVSIIAFVFILLTLAIGFLFLYMQRYMRSLYKSNLALLESRVFQPAKIDISPTKISADTGSKVPPTHQEDSSAHEWSENDKLSELYNRILIIMDDEKLFTRSDLSVSDLSERLGTNDKYISQAVNTFSKNNFNSFINAYRIQEARRIINIHGDAFAIKEIADMCGFSNVNSFHKKFKEITGLTPSLFIQLNIENKLESSEEN